MRQLVTIAILIATLSGARAGELTADQIIEKANLAAYYSGKDGKAKVKMTIVDRSQRCLPLLVRRACLGTQR